MKVPMSVVDANVAQLARDMAVFGKVPVYCVSEYIQAADLAATQHDVSEDLVDELVKVDAESERDLPPIDVAEIDGVFVIANGHHRAVATLRRGQPIIWALVRRPVTPDVPIVDDFWAGVRAEIEHQVRRWGREHDEQKEPADWIWLLGHLAGKALHAHVAGNAEKALHHCISSAAVLAHWHFAIKSALAPAPTVEEGASMATNNGNGERHEP